MGLAIIRMGIISELGGNYFLPRLVVLGKAKLFAFPGELVDVRKAEEIGLVAGKESFRAFLEKRAPAFKGK